MPAGMAMMAITTSNSISVKPFRAFVEMWDKCQAFKELEKGFALKAFGDLQVLRGEEDPVNVNRRCRANSPPLLSH